MNFLIALDIWFNSFIHSAYAYRLYLALSMQHEIVSSAVSIADDELDDPVELAGSSKFLLCQLFVIGTDAQKLALLHI